MEKEKEEIATDLKFPATAEIKIPWQKEIEREKVPFIPISRARTRSSIFSDPRVSFTRSHECRA